jgi:hypothetical protein
MLDSLGLQAFRPASSIVSWDTDTSPQSGTFHARERSGKHKNNNPSKGQKIKTR